MFLGVFCASCDLVALDGTTTSAESTNYNPGVVGSNMPAPPPTVSIEGCTQQSVTKLDDATGDVVVENGRAYFFLTDGIDCSALLAYDASNPAAPTQLSSLQGVCGDELVVNNRIVFSSPLYPQRLVAANFSNPAAPVTQGFLEIGGAMAVSGNTLYVMSSDLIPVDITDPAALIMRPALDFPGNADSLVISGATLYVLGGLLNALVAYDITNPAAPVKIGEWGEPSSSKRAGLVSGTTLYAMDDGAIYPYDISNPRAPEAATPFAMDFGTDHDLAVIGSRAYIANGIDDRIDVLDLSNPLAPTFVASTTHTEVTHLASAGNTLYAMGDPSIGKGGWLHILTCN